jgi:predicted extracellular nuclease
VRVDFALPPGVTYVGATVAGGFTASPSGSAVQFTGGSVATGGNVVLTVTVKAPSAPTTVTVTPGAVLADPLNTVTEGDEGNNASTGTVATVVSEPANLRKIHEVQGSTNTSPLTGQTVTVDAIVTGHYPGLSGFFLQEEDADADADPATSEGIFVFNGTTVAVGDRVRVAGTVAEFTSSGITVTELTTVTGVITISTGNTLPTPATVTLPVAAVTDLERYEGMRVAFTQTLTVTNTFDLGHFGEVTLSANGRLIQPTNVIDPNDNPASGTTSTGATNVAAVTAAQDLNNRNQILIEDGSTASFPGTIQFWDNTQNTLRLGSTADNLAGIMHHAFGSYRVLPQAITWTFAQRPLTPPPVGAANLKVAGMNTLNYFNGDGLGGGFPTSRGADTLAEFDRQRAKTIQAIHQLGADIVGLMEMENDGNGPNSAIQDLVNGLNGVAGAGTWAFVPDPAGYGSLPGGTDLIRPAIIYKTAAVTRVGASMASGDGAFGNARAPVAQTFQLANGQKVTVVANHFKSKGSGGSGLDLDQNDGQGFFNNSRKLQATALLNFVNTTVIPAAGDPKVVLLGDFNAYEQEDPMDILRAGGYTAMAEGITSYSFDAQSGALDHVLVSSALLPRVTGADKWHINADEPTIIDYNVENKLGAPGCVTACTAPDYYSTAPFRVSDHDPVLVGLFLAAAPTAPQNLQGTAGNAQIVLTYLAPASDGGSPVTGYSASCTDGGSNTGSGNSVAAGLTITVGSLVNGVTYSCTVTAANAIGSGPASTAATNLTPSTVPNAPTNVQGTAGNAQIVLTYLAPASNGGSAITGYSASCSDGGVNTGSGNSVGAGLAITVSSLVNGVTYACTVTAANANGSSVASSAATNLTPSTVPGAPTNVQGTPGNAQIVLTYLAPASNGGAAITGYNASCSDGGSNNGSGSSVGAALTLTVGSLVNGVTYSCTVTAANVRGAGPASTAATGLKPSTVPDPPTGINVTAGNAQASFTYTAPASNGGSPITGYSATCTGGSGATGNSAGAALLITISSLVNGTTYSCTFVAINANGSSAPSAPVVFTPSTVPGAPTNVQGAAGNTQIVLTYLAPASNGGSAITGYTAQCTDGGVNTGSGSSVGAGLTITVGSLVNGVTYSCTVRAVNANGPGTISSSATNLKPSAVPGAPTNVQGTAGDATATITYQAPASNGGSPITGYTASCTGGSGATGNSVGTALTITLNGLTNGVTYTCTVVANNANGPSVPSASVQVSPQQPSYALTVSKSGAGSGSVTSNPAGINCGATCVGTFANGGTVTLTATPAAGSAFAGWSGACSGTGACVVTMGGDRAVTASFGVASQSLTVTKGGTGAGTVSSTAPATPSIDCGATCSASFAHGTVVTLSATAAAGSTFVGWTGACSGSGGCSVTMDAAKIVTATFDSPPRLSNISSRMQVLTGNDVMIGGFVIGGSVTKRVAIVATGPSLAAFGITNALANPTLRLVRSSDQATIATSDDWQTAANQAELTAAGFAPSNALEAAILADLAPGAYTAIVEGASGGTGVSVIGVYEVNHPEAPLVNISTRGRVLTGNDVMIGGFVINGTGPQTVAIVATGPSLSQFGITSPLANPTIALVRSSDQAVIATNDDWQADASAAQLQAAGFAPSEALESGLYRTLPPGAYTVIVQGAGGGTGVAVVGIYRVN